MADRPDADSDEESTPGYKPPTQKSVLEILAQDKGDTSLEDYKRKLLGLAAGEAAEPHNVIIFPDNPKNVIVQKLGLYVEGRPEVFQDLSNLDAIGKQKFVIKEGCQYRLKMYYYVQRDIVTGLVYSQKVYKKGIRMGTNKFMAGSYGPKREMQCYTSPIEDAPTGMLARGSYTIKSTFQDDDKNEYVKWEWKLEIKKDWE